ncbi:MAG: hypothetical protein JNK82_37640 [Myxococcaceae bacterium]|nr:hypothetical protein [Myxococcaceae bacterium]
MERRTRRSNKIQEALKHFFDALRIKRNLSAVALTTDDGLFLGGSGSVDLELMGALGSVRRTAEFEGETLHVSRFEVNDVELCLTCLGAPVRDDAAVGSLMRMLAV